MKANIEKRLELLEHIQGGADVMILGIEELLTPGGLARVRELHSRHPDRVLLFWDMTPADLEEIENAIQEAKAASMTRASHPAPAAHQEQAPTVKRLVDPAKPALPAEPAPPAAPRANPLQPLIDRWKLD